MTPHPAPLLFVATEGGLARYLGEAHEFAVSKSRSDYRRPEYLRPEYRGAGDRGEQGDRNAAREFVAGACRLLGIAVF